MIYPDAKYLKYLRIFGFNETRYIVYTRYFKRKLTVTKCYTSNPNMKIGYER